MIPCDSIEKPEYIIGLENAARHLQIWYYNELGLNKTFTLHDPVVEVYHTPHESEWYSTNPNGSDYFWYNVLADGDLLTGRSNPDPDNVWVHYIDANPACEGQCGGCGTNGKVVISANDLKGLVGYEIDTSCPNVWRIYPPCRYVGGLGHELGHALGLSHPPACDEDFPTCWDHDIMMYGYTTYPDSYFNDEDKTRLNNSPFITHFNIEGLFFPNDCMELTDTCNYNTQAEASIIYGDSIFLAGCYQKTPGVYIDTINSVGDCDSLLLTHLTVIIPPVDAEDVSLCEGEVPLLFAEGVNIRWYSADTNPLIELEDDRDGQIYQTVAIGDQKWMAENLNYYTPSGSWYYNNDSLLYADIYGRLYNWVNAGKTCPSGWHLPDNTDWYNLIDHAGGISVTGGKIKETGYEHWDPPNTGASNTTGFTALPAGKKDFEGGFYHLGYYSKFWSASEYVTGWSNTFEARSNSAEIFAGNASEETAFSVRCIQDDNPLAGTGNYYISDYELPGKYTYYVTQTIFDSESPPDTVVLRINEIYRDPMVNDEEICEGDSLRVGNNYYTSSGTYFDTLQSTSNCDSVIVTELTVHPVYEIDQNAEICKGDSILLGGVYQTASGTIYDSLFTVHGCDSIIITELMVNPLPNVYLGKDTTITTLDTLVLDAGPGYINYLWNNGSAEQTITLQNLSVGDHEYAVRVENAENCTHSDTIIVHVVLPNSPDIELTYFDLEIFPNPTSDFLIIKSNTYMGTGFIINLIDNLGRVVYERKIGDLEPNSEIILDLLNLENGFYILRLNSTDLHRVQKIIKN